MVLSVVITVERNYASAANPNNQIEYLLETLIQKVDALEKKMEKQVDDVNTVVSKTAFQVDDLVTDVDNVKQDMAKGFDAAVVKERVSRTESTYNLMSDEIKKHKITIEDVSRALERGYHFVGNGYNGQYDDIIYKALSFSECGSVWNSARRRCTKQVRRGIRLPG